jgi:hypothetical protein
MHSNRCKGFDNIYFINTVIVPEEDYDAFCLAYMFTYRDFEMGTLGLAWTGDLKNAGGVCEKNGVRSLATPPERRLNSYLRELI